MSSTKIVVVQPYEKRKDEEGGLYALQPIQARDSEHGKGLARTLNCAGAIVFSRDGDPDLGEWEDAVILLTVGEVPETHEAMA